MFWKDLELDQKWRKMEMVSTINNILRFYVEIFYTAKCHMSEICIVFPGHTLYFIWNLYDFLFDPISGCVEISLSATATATDAVVVAAAAAVIVVVPWE